MFETFLIATPIFIFFFNFVAYYLFESKHDAAIIKTDKLAIKLANGDANTIDEIKANSKNWHVLDAYFTGLVYFALISLHVFIFWLLHPLPTIFNTIVFTYCITILHGFTRWVSHNSGVYKHWLGAWKDKVPTGEGKWDFSDTFLRWWHYNVFNHWILLFGMMFLSYLIYFIIYVF